MARNGVYSRLKDEWEKSDEVHVLAVDDSLVDRKVIERLLKITSCKVTAVDSGRRALQILGLDNEEEEESSVDDLKVDLVITDYCMPGMSGYELLKKIKGSSTFRELPVVMMSSENVLARIHRCLEEGAKDFIVKPVKLSDVKRLKSYMSGDTHEQDIKLHKTYDHTDHVLSLASSTSFPIDHTSTSPSSLDSGFSQNKRSRSNDLLIGRLLLVFIFLNLNHQS